jgi:hypothetical protein
MEELNVKLRAYKFMLMWYSSLSSSPSSAFSVSLWYISLKIFLLLYKYEKRYLDIWFEPDEITCERY